LSAAAKSLRTKAQYAQTRRGWFANCGRFGEGVTDIGLLLSYWKRRFEPAGQGSNVVVLFLFIYVNK
jgi:hypothetical protein